MLASTFESRSVTNLTGSVTSNVFLCDFCGKTNWYSTNIVDEGICGGSFVEGPIGTIGAAGIIQLNTSHACQRREFMLDVSMICAVILVGVLGSTAAIIKNRRRKISNKLGGR
jgi:hypothetical protein